MRMASADWGGVRHRIPAVASRGAWLLGLPGQRVAVTTTPGSPSTGPDPGTRAGTARFTLGDQTETVPLRLAHTLPEPTWWWKVLHN